MAGSRKFSPFSLLTAAVFLAALSPVGLRAKDCDNKTGETDPKYIEYTKGLPEGVTPKPYCDKTWSATTNEEQFGSDIVTTAELKDSNVYKQRAGEMDEASLSGHGFGEASREGVRGSGLLHSAGDAETAGSLLKTSNQIHRVGQVARVGTYLGYGAAAGAIGSRVIQYTRSDEEGPSKTAEDVNEIASKASMIVGGTNILTGALGYGLARRYDSRGIARINELLQNENITPNQRTKLMAAKQKYESARSKANDAAVSMVVQGGVAVAAGIATAALKKKIKEQQQDLETLEEEIEVSSGGAPSDGAVGATGTANTSSSGGPVVALNSPGSASAGLQTSVGADPNEPTLSLGGGTANVTSSGSGGNLISVANPSSGASIAPFRGKGAKSKKAANAGSAGAGDAGAEGGGGFGSDEVDQLADEMIESDSDPIDNEVGFAGGGGGAFGGIGGFDDGGADGNPIGSVFGQLNKFAKDLNGGDKKKKKARRISTRSLASGAAARYKRARAKTIHNQETNLFKVVRKKLFLMKYRGNI